MADKKIITDELLKLQTEKILQVVADLTYDFVPFDDTEISDILEITDEQAMQLTKILNDQVVANNKLWSSSKTDAEIKNALIESNKYADELIGKISSISLEYVTTLPTSDIKSNVIYILQGTPNTLNVYNESTSSFVSVGDLNLDLSGYYTSTQVDNLLADKADDNTVVHADDIVQDLTTTSGTTVLSSAGLQTELDKKFDKSGILSAISATPSDEKVLSEKAMKTELDKKFDKASIATSISKTSTDDEVASAKAVYDNTFMTKTVANIDNTDGSWIAQFIRPTSDKGTFPSESSDWYKVEQIKARDFIHQICTLHDSSNLKSTYIRGAWCNATLIENAKWSSWKKVLTDTDIASTIGSSSTDKQLVSAKAVYDNAIKDKNVKTYSSLDQISSTKLDTLSEYIKLMPDNSILITGLTNTDNVFLEDSTGLLPVLSTGDLRVYKKSAGRCDLEYEVFGNGEIKLKYISGCNYHNNYELIWKRVCTTTVNDVGKTVITPEDADISSNYQMFYYVSNGVCYVVLWGITSASTGQDKVICSSLPKANISVSTPIFSKNDGSIIALTFLNQGTTNLTISVYTAVSRGYISFSYPVAES